MKAKHNKKRNTAFLYEALTRELTKAIVARETTKSQKIKSIFKEHFGAGKALAKELSCYQALVESHDLDHYTAEKMIFAAKKEHEQIDKKRIFQEQSSVIKKINTQVGNEVYNNFVPNYRAYATIAQVFSDKVPVKSRVLLEKQLISKITGTAQKGSDMAPVDSLVVKSFSQRFNEQYSDLLPEQRDLLGKYILAFGPNEADFKLCVVNELKRIHQSVTESLKLEDVSMDAEMVTNTHKVLERISSFNIASVSEKDVLNILKLQNLVHEYDNDAPKI
jgi:hypothetical protein